MAHMTENKFDANAAIVNEQTSIREAMMVIDRAASQGAAVLASDHKLIGMITDGDVRRALINGAQLDDTIKGIFNSNALALPDTMQAAVAQEIMIANNLRQLPFVDAQGRFVRMAILGKGEDRLFNYPIFILAGGRGTRLFPYTEHTPKPLVQVNGMSLIERVILAYRKQGARNFILSINHMGDQIKELLSDGKRMGVQITYVEEPKRMGTAGSLSLLEEYLDELMIVTNADVICDIDLRSFMTFHQSRHASASMAVKIEDQQSQYGEVILEGEEIVDIREKPIHRKLVNAGVYALEPDIRALIQKNEVIDMPDLFRRAIREGLRATAYPMCEEWTDVGRPESLKEVEQRLCNHVAE